MFNKLLSGMILFSSFALAQEPLSDASQQFAGALRQQGSLVDIKIMPNNPIKIYVVGKEEGQINLSKLKISVRRLSPGPEKSLALLREADYFTLAEPLDPLGPTHLQITAMLKDKTEVFHFKLNNKP